MVIYYFRNTSNTFFKNRREDISLTPVQEEAKLERISKTEKLYLKALAEDLDKESKELIRFRFYEGFQFAEIAEILNLNINTVKSRFYKVLEIIKDKYEVATGSSGEAEFIIEE